MFGTYRTLLALMVVALHLGGVPTIGGYAVFGFYILSGYLMTLIMQNNYGYTSSGVARYALNRFLRIYPMYWIAIALSSILIFLVGENFSFQYHESMYLPKNFAEIVRNILLFFPSLESPRLAPPAWALTVEIFYYILIGIGLSKNKQIVLAWVILSGIYHVTAISLGFGWKQRYFTIPAASLPFSTGAFIYHYKYDLHYYVSYIKGRFERYLPFIIFILILINWFIGYITKNSKGIFFYSNYFLCAIMVVVLSRRQSLPFISKKLDKLMGDFSYPIYLVHYQVGLLIVALLNMAGFTCERPDLMLMFLSMPFIFLVSWIVTVVIERPVELLRTAVKKTNNPGITDT